MLPDEAFEAEISIPSLVSKYREQATSAEKSLRQAYEARREELVRLKIAGLEQERAHRDLLNLSVYPFTKQGAGNRQLGYSFLRASPLAELGLPNFDFLIARLEPLNKPVVVVLGEVKSSVGSPGKVVHQVMEKKGAFDGQLPFVLERYLGQPTTRQVIVDTVIVVDSVDSNNMVSAVVESKESIKVWHGPTSGPQMLSLAVPPRDTKHLERYLHTEQGLSQLLSRLPSARRVFDAWPTAHPLIQLESLITAAHPGESGMIVRTESLATALGHDLFYLSPEERSEYSSRLLRMGLEIEFLEPTIVDQEYRIRSRGLRRDILEETLQDRWVRWQLRKDLQQEIAAGKTKLQDALRAERARYKTMEEF